MRSNYALLKLLMWKNYLYYRRYIFRTFFQLMMPMVTLTLFVLLRHHFTYEEYDLVVYSNFCVNPRNSKCEIQNLIENFKNKALVYCPRGPKVDNLMKQMEPYFNEVIGYRSSKQLETHFKESGYNQTVAGIEFVNVLKRKKWTLHEKIIIKIRFPSELSTDYSKNWKTDFLYTNFPGPFDASSNTGGDPNYFKEGFLTIQQLLVMAMANITHHDFPNVYLKRFPYSERVNDSFYFNMHYFMPLFMMLLFIYPSVEIIRPIVLEKERELKALMTMVDVKRWLIMLSWFIKNLIFFTTLNIIVLLTTKILLSKYPIFPRLEWSVYFMFLLLYACSTVMYCFFLSTFFFKASTAVAVSSGLLILSFLPYYIKIGFSEVSLVLIFAMCLIPNTALCIGIDVIVEFEMSQDGIRWGNLFHTSTPNDQLTFGHILIMLCFDMIAYFLLTVYSDLIQPGPYATARPWYLIEIRTSKVSPTPAVDVPSFDAKIENEQSFKEIGIEIKSLSKKFDDIKAVNNLKLKVYVGEVTVLLGHRGCGKSTILSMLTGYIKPSQGTAIVNGYDIRENIGLVRQHLGICPQYNILFDILTVREHFHFFGLLRGLSQQEVHQETEIFIELLEFKEKANLKVMFISKSLKRKLCIGLAFCGSTKVVMIDAPTLNMDSPSKRVVWSFMQKNKFNRTVLICTQYTDEAAAVGDHIAIMIAGQLQCCGSYQFLEKTFGAGYSLTAQKGPECNVEALTKVIKHYIPDVRMVTNTESLVCYTILKKHVHTFGRMFRKLEKTKNELGVESFGLRYTNLRNILAKVYADYEEDYARKYDYKNMLRLLRTNADIIDNISFVKGIKLIKNQMKAMFWRRFYGNTRKILLMQILFPLFYLLLTDIDTSSYFDDNLPPLVLSLDTYEDPIVMVEARETQGLTKHYVNLIATHRSYFLSNITATMLELSRNTPKVARMRHIIGAKLEDDKAVAFFNGDTYHSAGLSLAFVLNTVYQNITNTSTYFEFINHPIPFTAHGEIAFMSQFYIGYAHAILVTFVVSITFMSYFYIKERISRFKHQQLFSGLNFYIYWITSFLYEIVFFIGIISFEDHFRLFIIISSFICAVIPFIFMLTYFFHSTAGGLNKIFFTGLVTGGFCGTIYYYLKSTSTAPYQLLFIGNPFFLFATVLLTEEQFSKYQFYCNEIVDKCIRFKNTTQEFCRRDACSFSSRCCEFTPTFYDLDDMGIATNFLYSVISCVLCFFIIFAIESEFFKRICIKCCYKKKQYLLEDAEDSDVNQMNETVTSSPHTHLMEDYLVIGRGISKSYKGNPKVSDVCLAIKPTDCFGLLGISNAGKTTLLRSLIGDLRMSSGEAWVGKYSVLTEGQKIKQIIGYCPQFGGLMKNFTVLRILMIFCLIRGFPAEHCESISKKYAAIFNLNFVLNMKIKLLSRCTQKKLNLAIALIGNPKIIFLDSPTEGLDPMARRHVWNLLRYLRNKGHCIIIASDFVEECEYLCTQIAIVVNGKLTCVGSVQHLNRKFAAGFLMVVKISKKATELLVFVLKFKIETYFPSAMIKDHFPERLIYYISDASMAWSVMFRLMETIRKEVHIIEDYSLGQCSLHEVFLMFIKNQQHD